MDVGCEVWTRIKRAVNGGSNEGECWLRSYRPTGVECDHCDSGVMSCEVYDNTDYTTTDDLIDGPNGKTDNGQDCCALCYGTSSKQLPSTEPANTRNTGECEWIAANTCVV